ASSARLRRPLAGAHRQACLEGLDAPIRAVDPVRMDLAAAHHLLDEIDGVTNDPNFEHLLVGDGQDIDPGFNGQAQRVRVPERIADGAHLHVVAEHDLVPAELPAEDAGDRGVRQGRGVFRVELRVEDVGGEDGIGQTHGDQVPERLELDRRPGAGDVDHAEMRVTGGAAVPGEMLDGAPDPNRVLRLYDGGRLLGHDRWVRGAAPP